MQGFGGSLYGVRQNYTDVLFWLDTADLCCSMQLMPMMPLGCGTTGISCIFVQFSVLSLWTDFFVALSKLPLLPANVLTALA